jgi:hypothetical protein
MSIVTREGKGSKLTIQEMDGNFEYLEGLSIKPYLVYTALLTQSRGGDPVPTVLENTFTGEIAFSYFSEGRYNITSSDQEFVQDRTLTQLQLWGDSAKSSARIGNVQWEGPDQLVLRVMDPKTGDLVNVIGGNGILASIEIRVYI